MKSLEKTPEAATPATENFTAQTTSSKESQKKKPNPVPPTQNPTASLCLD